MSDDLPMRDVVELVLQAEGESKRILEDAQAEAERIAAKARSESQSIVQTRRRETAEQVDAIVRNAQQNAQREKEEQLSLAAADIPSPREPVDITCGKVTATRPPRRSSGTESRTSCGRVSTSPMAKA